MILPKHLEDKILATPGVTVSRPGRGFARGSTGGRKPGMNSFEAAYGERLEAMKRAGEIVDYQFEACGLRLAKKTFYHPDFLVITKDGVVEFHEVKGFWRDDARVKIKVAAEKFNYFRFVAAVGRKRKGVWDWKMEVF